MAQCAHFSHFQHRLPFVFLILSPEPLGGAGALWTLTIPSRFLSLTLPHPWNIMWDEGNCYGKLNEIKREKQLHSPLSCAISELSVWWSRPDGLRVWWSWQAAAPGLMGTQYLGLFSFMPVHRSLYLSSVVFSILSLALSLSPALCRANGLSIIPLTPSTQILAHSFQVCVHVFLFVHSVHGGSVPPCTLLDFSIGSRTQWPPTSWASLLNWN